MGKLNNDMKRFKREPKGQKKSLMKSYFMNFIKRNLLIIFKNSGDLF